MRLVAAVLLPLLLLTACGGGGDAASPSATVTVTKTVTAEPTAAETVEDPGQSEGEASFEDDVLTTSDLEIEITSHKVIEAGAPGNEYGDKPVVAFYYDTTNLGGGEVSPMDFLFHFEAVQDNDPDAVNELDVGLLPDDRFLESQSEDIKQGGTVESAIAYELDDLTTPVELIASEAFGDEVGRATYQLGR